MKRAVEFLGRLLSLAALLTLLSCNAGQAPQFKSGDDDAATPPEDTIGERLFLDTRFAEFFAVNMTGVNEPLTVGDPVVQQVQTTTGTLPGPFAGQSINCRSCHFVTEFQGVAGAGNRTYSDFTSRSPMPRMIGGYTETPRNSMHMVGSLQPHSGPTLLHFDGEFATPEDLVKGTLTGRNFGWAPDQFQQAEAQVALVVRGDDGSSQLAQDRTNGISYSTLFLGTDKTIPASLLIPAADRIDVNTASNDQIVNLVAKCISTYMGDLLFKQDQFGRYIGSPYDVFLRINHLPTQPNAGETFAQYNQRLLQIINGLSNPDLGGWNLRRVQVSRPALSVWRAGICRSQDLPYERSRRRGWHAARGKLRRLSSGPELYRLQLSQHRRNAGGV